MNRSYAYNTTVYSITVTTYSKPYASILRSIEYALKHKEKEAVNA